MSSIAQELPHERRFIALTHMTKRTIESGADIDTIYDVVFGTIYKAVESTGIHFTFEIPHAATHSELLNAYVDALMRKAEQLQRIVDAADREPATSS